jgi:hypothetical protein
LAPEIPYRLRHAPSFSADVREVFAPDASGLSAPPNPNLALNRFVVPGAGDGALAFDDAAWVAAAQASPAWDSISWSDVSWSDVSWADSIYGDVG